MPTRPRLPSFRATLLGLHRDILAIERHARWLPRDPRLTPVERAVLMLEDHRFFAHRGIDWRWLPRQVKRLCTGRRLGGTSTIDMQLFRTVSGRYERTIRRKARESVGAYALQKKLDKIAILRAYLSVAYFGTGLIGADAAAEAMYGKRADDLGEGDAYRLAAMLVYPKPSAPSRDWFAKIDRRAGYGQFLARAHHQRLEQLPR